MSNKLNKARHVLLDPEEKQKYDKALEKFNLVDGKCRDATYNNRLREASIVRKKKKMIISSPRKE